jgi:hypothetical protein
MKLFFTCLVIVVLAGSFQGCVGSGPQLSFERGSNPSGDPVPAPVPTTNTFGVASGGTFAQSARFRSFSNSVSVSGTRSQGNIYQMMSSALSVADKRLREGQ